MAWQTCYSGSRKSKPNFLSHFAIKEESRIGPSAIRAYERTTHARDHFLKTVSALYFFSS